MTFARPIFFVRSSLVALFALGTVLSVAQPASAAFIATTTSSSKDAETVSYIFDGKAKTTSAGAFSTTLYNFNGSTAYSELTTYCADLNGTLAANQIVDLAAISTLPGGYGAYVGSLYANFAAGATTSAQKAGLQLAIWKTEYDGVNSMSNTGRFVVTAASQDVTNYAAYYYLNNKLVTNSTSYLRVASGGSGQSLLGPSSLAPAAVPEPASVVLLGIGLVGGLSVAACRRHRRPASPSTVS